MLALLLACLATVSARATVLLQDYLNYPNGCIETDGLWQVYAPAPPNTPYGDALVENSLLILNQTNHDSVDSQFTNSTGSTGSTITFASFTINVTSLPTSSGGYFCMFQDSNNVDEVGRVYLSTTNAVAPGTYRIGVNNWTNSASVVNSQAHYYPLDLATNTTYLVVFNFDTNNQNGASLEVNPLSLTDFNANSVFGTDNQYSSGQASINISQIGFSQYASQGVAEIGDVMAGTTFNDVFSSVAAVPVIAVQPPGTNIYSGNSALVYTVANGLGQLTYQWYSNSVALTDDGINVIGPLPTCWC